MVQRGWYGADTVWQVAGFIALSTAETQSQARRFSRFARPWKVPAKLCLLTSKFGQTFSCPVALAADTVVVVHDTRYGPGPTGNQTRQSQHLKTTIVDVDPITAEIRPTKIQGP